MANAPDEVDALIALLSERYPELASDLGHAISTSLVVMRDASLMLLTKVQGHAPDEDLARFLRLVGGSEGG